jgi:hypothetical protein
VRTSAELSRVKASGTDGSRVKRRLFDAALGCRAQQPGGVDVRFDAGGSGLAAEGGMGMVGMAAVVDHDPNGAFDCGQLIQAD